MHISRDDFQNTLTALFDTLAHAFFKIMLDVHNTALAMKELLEKGKFYPPSLTLKRKVCEKCFTYDNVQSIDDKYEEHKQAFALPADQSPCTSLVGEGDSAYFGWTAQEYQDVQHELTVQEVHCTLFQKTQGSSPVHKSTCKSAGTQGGGSKDIGGGGDQKKTKRSAPQDVPGESGDAEKGSKKRKMTRRKTKMMMIRMMMRRRRRRMKMMMMMVKMAVVGVARMVVVFVVLKGGEQVLANKILLEKNKLLEEENHHMVKLPK